MNEAFTSLDVRQQALLGSREFRLGCPLGLSLLSICKTCANAQVQRRYAELTGYDGGAGR